MYKYLFFMMFLLFSNVSCDKTLKEPTNEEELITTLIYTLTSVSDGEKVIYSFADNDGIGGNPPVITTTGSLLKNNRYVGNITLKNESKNPVLDITSEILNESTDHQFFYLPTENIANTLIIKYIDSDPIGNPIGIMTEVVTGEKGVGKLYIILRHKPDKNGLNVKSGNIANAGGETDIEVSFDINVE